jgi:hypothetical protein
LPPLLAWTLSLLIFNTLAFDLSAVSAQLTGALAVRREGASIARAEEASLRILWAGSLLLFTLPVPTAGLPGMACREPR